MVKEAFTAFLHGNKALDCLGGHFIHLTGRGAQQTICGIIAAETSAVPRSPNTSPEAEVPYSGLSDESRTQFLLKTLSMLGIESVDLLRALNTSCFADEWNGLADSMFSGMIKGLRIAADNDLRKRGEEICSRLSRAGLAVLRRAVDILKKAPRRFPEGEQPSGSQNANVNLRLPSDGLAQWRAAMHEWLQRIEKDESFKTEESKLVFLLFRTAFAIFSQLISDILTKEQVAAVSKWVGLPTDEWSLEHAFALASAWVNCIEDSPELLGHPGSRPIAGNLKGLSGDLKHAALPPLPRPLTAEILGVLDFDTHSSQAHNS
jgi:hypothetical protein